MEADAERQRSGKKRRGKAPKEIDETPADKAQMSFTDPELHIMQTNNKGWDYCGNAQASVDGAYQIIVACDVTDATNDKQQAEPMGQAILETLKQAEMALPRNEAGEVHAIPATLDSGYYSEAATQALEALGFEPYIATARQRHHAPAPEALEGHGQRTYGGESPESGRSGVVQPSQGHRRAGIWSDQGGAWVPSFSAARFGQGAGRMALGMPGAQSTQAVALWTCLEDGLSSSEPPTWRSMGPLRVGRASGTSPLAVLR